MQPQRDNIVDRLSPLSLAIGVGVFVAGFLLVFRPFGLEVVAGNNATFWLILGVAPLNVFLILLIDRSMQWLKRRWKWLNHKSAAIFATVSLIIAGNVVYQAIFQQLSDWKELLDLIWNVALIAAFPTVFVILYYRGQHSKSKRELSTKQAASALILHDETSKETLNLYVEDILYITSDRNYALVHTRISPKPRLMRSSLKALEKQLAGTSIVRCHRSYLVNTSQVIHRKKTARRLLLTLRDTPDPVPVSVQFIKRIEGLLSGH